MMEQTTNQNNNLKLGVFGFLMFLVFTIAYTAYRTRKTSIQVDVVEEKVDSRYYSYDNLFYSTNSVVVDSSGKKIGEVYILTDDEAIEKFYSDSTRRKTKYYYNLKERVVKIKDK